jgi:hypothetical protein
MINSATKQSILSLYWLWIAARSLSGAARNLSSGARSRDALAPTRWLAMTFSIPLQFGYLKIESGICIFLAAPPEERRFARPSENITGIGVNRCCQRKTPGSFLPGVLLKVR